MKYVLELTVLKWGTKPQRYDGICPMYHRQVDDMRCVTLRYNNNDGTLLV